MLSLSHSDKYLSWARGWDPLASNAMNNLSVSTQEFLRRAWPGDAQRQWNRVVEKYWEDSAWPVHLRLFMMADISERRDIIPQMPTKLLDFRRIVALDDDIEMKLLLASFNDYYLQLVSDAFQHAPFKSLPDISVAVANALSNLVFTDDDIRSCMVKLHFVNETFVHPHPDYPPLTGHPLMASMNTAYQITSEFIEGESKESARTTEIKRFSVPRFALAYLRRGRLIDRPLQMK